MKRFNSEDQTVAKGRHWLRPLMVISLLFGACASDEGSALEADGYLVADRVIATVSGQEQTGDATQAQTIRESDCIREILVDEYGFEEEILTCPDEPAGDRPVDETANPSTVVEDAMPSTVSGDDILAMSGSIPPTWWEPLVGAIPDPEIRSGFGIVGLILNDLEAACGGNFDDWSVALELLAVEAERLIPLVEAQAEAEYFGSSEARALERLLIERALSETGCSSPGGSGPLDAAVLLENGRILRLTSRAALAVAELGRQLSTSTSTALFGPESARFQYEWMRSETEDISVLIVGTSQSGAAIEIAALADGLNQNVGHAYLAGALAEVQEYWLPEVEQYIDASLVLWFMGPLDFMVDCGTSTRGEQFVNVRDQRRETFAAAGWFADLDPLAIVLGPPGGPDPARGNAAKREAPNPEHIESARLGYGAALENAGFCEDRAMITARIIRRLQDDGHEVIVVGMPMSPLAYEHVPEGFPGVESAMLRLEADYISATGATFVDLTGELQRPEVWGDYSHMTQTGADEFTALVLDLVRASDG